LPVLLKAILPRYAKCGNGDGRSLVKQGTYFTYSRYLMLAIAS